MSHPPRHLVTNSERPVRIGRIIIALLAALSRPTAARAALVDDGVAPQGKRFMLALYSVGSGADLEAAKAAGWNTGHSYQYSLQFVDKTIGGSDLLALGSLPGEEGPVSAEGRQLLIDSAKSPRIAWWDLPEEKRSNIPAEVALIKEYVQLTRTLDSRKRPNYMYIPGHYSQDDVEDWVGPLDVVPAAVYTHGQDQPHAWARWRVESTIAAIKAKGFKVGRDYIAGEKWPAAVLELYIKEQDAEGCYHDFWQSLASGAKAILVYSMFYRNISPGTQGCWKMLLKGAAELTGPEGLDQMFLDLGELRELPVAITAGPAQTPTFMPALRDKRPVTYTSVRAIAKTWNGSTFVVAINSATAAVTARLSGLPNGDGQASVLFQNRSLPLAGGTVTLELPALGVSILKVGGVVAADAGAPPLDARRVADATAPDAERVASDALGLDAKAPPAGAATDAQAREDVMVRNDGGGPTGPVVAPAASDPGGCGCRVGGAGGAPSTAALLTLGALLALVWRRRRC